MRGASPATFSAYAMTRNRIYSELHGGLGNQMFQYAAGRALATRLEADLTLVVHNFHRDRAVNFLDPFEIDAAVIPRWPRADLQRPRNAWQGWVRYRLDQRRRSGLPIYRSRGFHANTTFFELTGDCYLVGYWQSPLYFEAVAPRIRADFDLGRFAGPETDDLQRRVEGDAAVCVNMT